MLRPSGPERLDERRIDLDGHRSLQQCDRYYEAMRALELYKKSFQSTQRTGIDLHTIPGLQERPRLARKSRGDKVLNGIDLGVVHGNRRAVESDNLDNTWSGKDRQPIVDVQATKEIPREKRGLNNSDSIRPAPSALVRGHERFVAFSSKKVRNCHLVASPHLQCEPRSQGRRQFALTRVNLRSRIVWHFASFGEATAIKAPSGAALYMLARHVPVPAQSLLIRNLLNSWALTLIDDFNGRVG